MQTQELNLNLCSSFHNAVFSLDSYLSCPHSCTLVTFHSYAISFSPQNRDFHCKIALKKWMLHWNIGFFKCLANTQSNYLNRILHYWEINFWGYTFILMDCTCCQVADFWVQNSNYFAWHFNEIVCSVWTETFLLNNNLMQWMVEQN